MRIIFFDCQCSLSTISLSYIHIPVVKVEPKARNALHGGVHVKLSRFQGVHTVLRPLFYSNQIDYEKHRNGLGYVFTRSRFKFIGDGAGTQEPYVHYGGSAARTALVTPGPAWTLTFDKLSHLRSTRPSTLEISTFRIITLTIQWKRETIDGNQCDS